MAGPIVRERVQFTVTAYQGPIYNPSLFDELMLGANTPDEVPILFQRLQEVQTGVIYSEDDEEPSKRDLRIELFRADHLDIIRDLGLSHLRQQPCRDQLRDRVIHILSTKFNVPEEHHQTEMDQIFKEVDKDGARTLLPIALTVEDYTVRLRLHIPKEEQESLEEVGIDSEQVKREGTCSICLNEFDAAAPIARLPSCQHVFHKDCVLRWIKKKPSCPMCRCPSLKKKKKRKLEEMSSSSTPNGPPSNIPRIAS